MRCREWILRNYLDLLLILFFAFCLLGTVLRLRDLRADAAAGQNQDLILEAVIEGSDPRVAEALTVGERLYFASGELFGALEETMLSESRIWLIEDGVCYSGAWELEERCDILLHIRCTGTLQNGRALREGRMPISVGESLVLYGRQTELHLRVIGLSLGDQMSQKE